MGVRRFGPAAVQALAIRHCCLAGRRLILVGTGNLPGARPCLERHSPDALTGRLTRPRRILRKEVIQPQVPLRLPCYDLVPITEVTFDACLSCELAWRLRVPPAFVA